MIKKITVWGFCWFAALLSILQLTHLARGFNSFSSSGWHKGIEYEQRLTISDALSNQTGGIAILGDSVNYAGPWSKLFPERQTYNFGINRDTAQGYQSVLVRLSKVCLMIGINDLSLEFSQRKIVKNIFEMGHQITTVPSETELFIQSALPRVQNISKKQSH